MKIKNFFTIAIAAVVVSFCMFSCQQDEVAVQEPAGVEFNIASDMVPANGRVANDDLPIIDEGLCDMELADYAVVTIGEVAYTLNIQEWGGDYKTTLVELPPGVYTVNSFVVFDEDDNAIFAVPHVESDYAKFVDVPVPFEFEIINYTKLENEIEVLCIEEFTPPEFGFKFWDIDLIKVKYFCIFANYCEEEFGHRVAALEIFVYPSAQQIGEEYLIWSAAVQGEGELLCIPLPYDPEVDPEEQTFYIELFINGIKYVATISIAEVCEIMESDKGYLHLNENCQGDIEPFARIGMLGFEDLQEQGNDLDYNDIVLGYRLTGNGDVLKLDILPVARGAGFDHRFELVFQEGEVDGVTGSGSSMFNVDGKTVVVLHDGTNNAFGHKFVNVSCDGNTQEYSVQEFEIDITEDFVYYFDKPLKPCLHTIPGEDPVYNLFLWEWNDDGQSVFEHGDVYYPNGIITPHDWTEGIMWDYPQERHSILVGYPNFSDVDNWDPNWYLVKGSGLYSECD